MELKNLVVLIAGIIMTALMMLVVFRTNRRED